MASDMSFAQEWQAEILEQPPLIAPARQFVYPRQVAGEEDTLARGALLLRVRPATGGEFLATCARGFTDPRMPTGIYACPNPRELCAVAGGYAYIIDSAAPEKSTHIPLRPVAELRTLHDFGLLIFVGFHHILAWGSEGLAWQSARLSYEGVRLIRVEGQKLLGMGWNMMTDREVEFAIDLRTGAHTGGGY